jgi:hypothetical protein
MLPLCFVLMPFGKKTIASGTTVDFDRRPVALSTSTSGSFLRLVIDTGVLLLQSLGLHRVR